METEGLMFDDFNQSMKETFNNSINAETIIMDENVYAIHLYLTMTIINTIEMVAGLCLGFYATGQAEKWYIGFIGHMGALAAVLIGSLWIWNFYALGISNAKNGKLTKLGFTYGPEEPNVSSLYAGTLAFKWLLWVFQTPLVLVFLVGGILGDWYALIAFFMKLVCWGIDFYFLIITEEDMFNWIDAARERATKEKIVGEMIVKDQNSDKKEDKELNNEEEDKEDEEFETADETEEDIDKVVEEEDEKDKDIEG